MLDFSPAATKQAVTTMADRGVPKPLRPAGSLLISSLHYYDDKSCDVNVYDYATNAARSSLLLAWFAPDVVRPAFIRHNLDAILPTPVAEPAPDLTCFRRPSMADHLTTMFVGLLHCIELDKLVTETF